MIDSRATFSSSFPPLQKQKLLFRAPTTRNYLTRPSPSTSHLCDRRPVRINRVEEGAETHREVDGHEAEVQRKMTMVQMERTIRRAKVDQHSIIRVGVYVE